MILTPKQILKEVKEKGYKRILVSKLHGHHALTRIQAEADRQEFEIVIDKIHEDFKSEFYSIRKGEEIHG
jgi:hypothetical protein